jgi:ZIP family zinc transporter
METISLGFISSLLAGLCTGVGALPVLFADRLKTSYRGMLLGLGGGVMLAATAFSLIVPATEAAMQQGYSKGTAAAIVSVGIVIGTALLWSIHHYLPHEHFFKGREGIAANNFKRIWLFVLAVTLHNFPEGLAVGVGVGGETINNALPLVVGIGLQNMPEGLVVALALRELQYSMPAALGIATFTGLVEPVGGTIGAALVGVAATILPWGMAVAAGAMLFVIVDEIIPEIDRESIAQEGSIGIIAGFILMMYLDIALG